MPLTLQKRYIIALENAGYRHVPNSRTGKYFEMTYQGEGTAGLFRGEHRMLIGPGGALRVTSGSVANSSVVSDGLAESMLAAVSDDVREAKRLYPNSAAFAIKPRRQRRRGLR